MYTERPKKNNLFKHIKIRCYAELNDFLQQKHRQKQFVYPLKTPVTLRETVESLGIPLSEVDLLLVNNQPADLDQGLHEYDSVSLFPTFEILDISELKGKDSPPLRIPRFILDAHLGKLSKYLRMLGFDSLYRNDYGDNEIIELALREKRIILTRDKLLLQSRRVTHGYYVRATEKHDQLREVVKKFDLYRQFKSFTRCMSCNALLVSKTREEIRDLVQEYILQQYHEFYFCPHCIKVFWKGSHFKRMETYIRNLT